MRHRLSSKQITSGITLSTLEEVDGQREMGLEGNGMGKDRDGKEVNRDFQFPLSCPPQCVGCTLLGHQGAARARVGGKVPAVGHAVPG